MTQDTPPPRVEDALGTVAEEAAKLVAAFGAASAAAASASPGPSPPGEPVSGESDQQGSPPVGAGPRTDEGSCRHQATASQPIACALCPVCQLIALLRTVRPETVDRLADLAAAATTALRDIASSGAAVAAARGEDAPGTPREPTRSRAVPIDVVDEDEEHPL